MKIQRTLYTICLIIFTANGATAQKFISGKVVDHLLMPIQNAHIQSSVSMAVTDESGFFKIELDSLNITLKISHIAFIPQSVKIKSFEKPLEIRLQPHVAHLKEFSIGFETRKEIIKTPASVGIIGPKELERFDNASILPAVNTIPGVRMEERSPGSYRFSIRGSLIRSPFGVRNVKFYLNGIPFTDATGNTQLNLIDFYSIGRMEILKGPAGSIFGAGNGGVVLLDALQAKPGEKFIQATSTSGSFGLRSYNLLAAVSDEKTSNTINYSRRESEGYRKHSAMKREMFSWNSTIKIKESQSISIHALYSDLFYQIPGAINEQMLLENPRSARPGSIEQNSSINLKTFNLGASHKIEHKGFSNISSVFAANTAFD
nr:TonB-dependent receptor plug domain-containing protein [Bacteroidota bacterium]